MNVILDTDIASCLSKIDGFEIVFKLFPNSPFFVPPRVFEELEEAEEMGFRFVEGIFSLLRKSTLEITPLNEGELRDYEAIDRIGKFGYGEKACIAICRSRRESILLSNDGYVNKKAGELGIRVYNLEDLLLLAIEESIIRGEEELENLMIRIETLDRVRIRGKDYLRAILGEKRSETS